MAYLVSITQSRLKELLSYDPATGVFTWLVTPNGRVPAGSIAGGLNGDGYLRIQIDGKRYRAHRLAWLYMMGAWPIKQIDHQNRVRDDNRWDNLRPATHGQNCRNSKPWGVSKHKGVSFHNRTGRWQASAWLDGKNHNLGHYDAEQEAAGAYATFAAKHFPEFARLV